MHPEPLTGYEIRSAKIPIVIAIRPLRSLLPHEEVVEEELFSLSRSITLDKVLRHPILADSRTGVVLDGTHRFVVLERLGYRLAPVALVDYQSPAIRIDRWYRIFHGAELDDDLYSSLSALGFEVREEKPVIGRRLLEAREISMVLEDENRLLVFPRPKDTTPLTALQVARKIEEFMLRKGCVLSYQDARPSPTQSQTLALSPLRLEKS
ncbi:MAG TPA: hypothetical protein VE177_07225, partial [Candidatus Binatus sp.]|nr:hypothetical protein [Candidatus Binatus sp.]